MTAREAIEDVLLSQPILRAANGLRAVDVGLISDLIVARFEHLGFPMTDIEDGHVVVDSVEERAEMVALCDQLGTLLAGRRAPPRL